VRSAKSSASIAMKPGLNRRENRLRSRGALQRLEPDDGKLSRPVLRGGSGGNAALLPDLSGGKFWQTARQETGIGLGSVVEPRFVCQARLAPNGFRQNDESENE